MRTALRLTRWLLDLALISLVLSVLSLVLAANIGPAVGHQMVVIRGSSMSPAIPLGAVVDLTRVQPKDLKVGDVVTLKSPGGTVYTHRINRIAQLPDGLYIETKGDAVAQPDTPLQPVSEVTGRVAYSLPYLGLLMYMLTIPTGVLSIFSLALMLLLCIWLLEDLEQHEDHDPLDEYECELARTLDALRMRERLG
ncbi:MAG: signal peptidase I [Candidatus Limnocylindrales bacterium]|jgi:signal peptidase